MNGGILMTLAGVWLGCQVFGGSALERLGLIGDPPVSPDGSAAGGGDSGTEKAAKKGAGIGAKAGALVGLAGGPVGAGIGAASGAIAGAGGGAAVHAGKSLAETLFGPGTANSNIYGDNPLGAGP